MARGHYLAGLIALDAGDIASAERAFAATVESNDRHAGAWAQLARLYFLAGEFVKAEGCLANAVATTRGGPHVADLIGTVCRLAGMHEASRDWHRRAVAAAPERVEHRVNLANAEWFCGDAEAAAAELRRCLSAEPENALVHWLLSRTRTASSAAHLREMRTLLQAAQSTQDLAYLNYAAGKECEDLEDWDATFGYYRAGAAARRRLVAYDEEAEVELFAEMEALFTKEWLQQRRSECTSNVPVFIIGQPRTGTTLLDRMLDAHPAVRSAGELRHFGLALRRVAEIDEPRQYTARLMHAAAAVDPTHLGTLYLSGIERIRSASAHVVDKLPSNFHFLPLILAALPNARVLHLRRDPMDTCFAAFKQLFAGGYLHSYDLGETGRHYARYAQFMSVMRDRFGTRFLDVDYEHLVTDTEDCLRRVLGYVGLSWNAACLDYVNASGAVATQSAGQVRQRPHRRSIGRWQKFRSQLQPLYRLLDDAGLLRENDFDADRDNP